MNNPYSGVNWATATQVKSFSHLHLTNQTSFEQAIEMGYKHIPTSHYIPSAPKYPLAEHYQNVPDDVIGSPNSEKIWTVGGGHYNALGSFAEGYGHDDKDREKISPTDLADMIFSQLQYSDGGGMTINHPVGWKQSDNPQYSKESTIKRCCDLLDYDDRVLGIEVYNNGYEASYGSYLEYYKGFYKEMLPFWDAILKTGRKCFGFWVIDWFDTVTPYYGSHILLVPEFTEHECLKAYRNGAFYGIIKDTGLRFTNLALNGKTLNVGVNKECVIDFYTDRGLVKSITGTSASCTAIDKDVFLRVEVTEVGDADSRIFSNAIMFKNKDDVAHEAESARKRDRLKKFLILSSS